MFYPIKSLQLNFRINNNIKSIDKQDHVIIFHLKENVPIQEYKY